jgi:ABC-type lipoprotein release transport system permease subunit
MSFARLLHRSLLFYWRTNLAVLLGVAVAVTVLSGALLVGESVRGSLRDLVLQRIGRTDFVIAPLTFFREALADDLRGDPAFSSGFTDACPLIVVQGLVSDQSTGRRASRVQVYGIDDRFWRFHGVRPPQEGTSGFQQGRSTPRDVLLSTALARDIGATVGATVVVRAQRPSAIPLESLHADKEDLGRTTRLTVRGILDPAALGEFSLQPQQGDVRAAFVPLARLQQELDLRDRVNALLVSTSAVGPRSTTLASLQDIVDRRAALEDFGMKLRILEGPGVLALEAEGTVMDDARADGAVAAARAGGMRTVPILTYLANSIRSGEKTIPYSLVTAIDLTTIAPPIARRSEDPPPVVLNEWAANDLAVRVGAPLTLEYYVWEDPGQLVTRSADFRVAAIVPIAGAAADRDFAPTFPGITNSENVRDWDPPFPVDLRRIRPVDEEYWKASRTTPKAFVPLDVGQALWRSRYGALTSIRIAPASSLTLADARGQFADGLRERLNPRALGLAARDVRAEGLSASRGATDFGEYFAYFSVFLVVAALLLASLFFKLGVEQRVREVGLFRSLGFRPMTVRGLLTAEGLLLSGAGSLVGLLGALGYGGAMMAGLRTWWVDAVGTTALTLHVSAVPLLAGATAGLAAAVVCVWWSLRSLERISERSLLAGELAADHVTLETAGRLRPALVGFACLAIAVLLLGGSASGIIDRTAAFFGAGASLLASALAGLTVAFRRTTRATLAGHGVWSVSRLGLRNASYRPGRSVLSVAVIASATFILIAVDAFRRDERITLADRRSGTGGYALLAESLLPLVHDPNSAEGRRILNLESFDGITFTPFRALAGDDTSCLNLYEPQQPRILAARPEFINAGRFAFRATLDATDAERANPWRLLDRELPDGTVPVIADANSLSYVLHRKVGDEIAVAKGDRTLRLRVVAALADSIFQGSLVMSEPHFLRLFPAEPGYRVLLVDAPADRAEETAARLEDRLEDFGVDAVSTGERLAEFHRVENTYLSTFQTLGGLGLLLGTIGLTAVLLRNVLERRKELALLGAVGYRRRHVLTIVIAENVLLLACGLFTGFVCALIAIAPAAADRGGRLPTGAGAWLLLFAVLATGVISSVVAARAAMRARLLEALRSE